MRLTLPWSMYWRPRHSRLGQRRVRVNEGQKNVPGLCAGLHVKDEPFIYLFSLNCHKRIRDRPQTE